ncbi:MAG: helix-hairpin-helix domain-containing protein [Chloroflexota bacterium]
MTQKRKISNFVIGFLLSGLVWLLFWYWQKSTSAEDGALEMLERLAAAEARAKASQARFEAFKAEAMAQADVQVTVAAEVTAAMVDDLQTIKGVGPVFASRFQGADIASFAAVAAQTADFVAELLDIGPNRAADIIAEAKKLV